jgi:hypothetical protein
MTISERKCAYGCGASVESPDGYAWGGVPLIRLAFNGSYTPKPTGGLLTECQHEANHFKCSDKRLALACGDCYTTKAMKGITVANGYGR